MTRARHSRVSPRPGLIVLALALSLVASGCHSIGNPSRRMVPVWYRGNPWGLDANLKRASGAFSPVETTPKIAAWEAWGRSHLQDGDILFRMGDARAVFGLFRFSLVTAEIGESLFSHTAIVAREANELVVYDISSKGPSRQPFAIWMLDVVGAFGVKRPKPEFQNRIHQAVGFCKSSYLTQTHYDFAMKPGNNELYCVEMTEDAYRTAGLPLSEPIPIGQLPGFHRHKQLAAVVEKVSKIKRTHRVYMPGSDRFGIWSSPVLNPVYFAPAADQPLADGIALRPYGPGYR